MKGSTALSTCFSISGGSKATGAGSALFLEPNRRRVPRLDLDDSAGRRQHFLRLDRRGGAVVGADAGVLEGLRQLQEAGRAAVGELEFRLRHRLAAELLDSRGERFHVLLLVIGQQRDQLPELAAPPHPAFRLSVELGLEVLEGEREVEDRDVAAAARPQRPPDVGTNRERSVEGASCQRALEDHLATGEVFAVLVDGYADQLRVFGLLSHRSSPLVRRRPQPTRKGSTDLRTVLTSAGLAKAPSGVIDSPSRVLRTAAWRPSTLWMARAEARTSGLLMFAACPR
jgi:hypothetical protein